MVTLRTHRNERIEQPLDIRRARYSEVRPSETVVTEQDIVSLRPQEKQAPKRGLLHGRNRLGNLSSKEMLWANSCFVSRFIIRQPVKKVSRIANLVKGY